MELSTAEGVGGWKHTPTTCTTITYEAWDQKYKPNQDWNHAWGAAPANLLPRFILGVEPITAGWKQARIRPQPGTLSFAKGKIPTPRGPISVDWENGPSFQMKLTLPDGISARLELPATPSSTGVSINGRQAAAKRVGSYWLVDEMLSGEVAIQVNPS